MEVDSGTKQNSKADDLSQYNLEDYDDEAQTSSAYSLLGVCLS